MPALSRLRKLVSSEPSRLNADAYPRVELFRRATEQGTETFGNYLSTVVVSRILSLFNHVLEEEVERPSRLLAGGSILHAAQNGDTIWGSGINGTVPDSAHRYQALDVRAVRGPLTRDFLQRRGITVPEVYGDPALLLPRLFAGRFRASDQRPYVVVPSLHDMKALSGESNLVSPLQPWNTGLERILEASFVISSSLHGLVVAEAFGIPARYLRISENEHPLKYEDYALGTGRSAIDAATSIAEAIDMGGMPPPRFDEAALLESFPIDLWREGR